MSAARLERDDERPVVAHVNYLFFHSTQSFIYFYLSRFRRITPICLTRAPESPAITREIPGPLRGAFHVYGGRRRRPGMDAALWSAGLSLRRALTRLPAGVGGPVLEHLHRRVVPRLRADADPGHFLDWAARILRQRRARLVHAYFGPIGWRMLALKRTLGLPLVVTFLGDELAPTLAPWWSAWIRGGAQRPDWPARVRELFASADLFLVEGPYLRERLIELGGPADKIQVQPIAVPLEQIPFRPSRPPRNGKTMILFAGRFCEQKGLLYALDAVRELWRERRDFELRLVGDETLTDGRYAARVYAYIREHGLQECVRPLGFLNHDDYLQQMQEADLFLHPSVVDSEGRSEGGAPTTILEAQATGLPVVSTYHCDIPNVTVPGKSALLVPERDGKALYQALRWLLDAPETWEAMGRAGRRFIEQAHDIDRATPLLESRYLALLEPRDRAASS